LPGDLRIRQMNQEHGFLPGLDHALKVGERLRILPNHVCSTASQYDRYHVIDENGTVVDSWTRTTGW
jgi:D-serine deaminase-like pyridoxal phosphate-dependent protein